MKKTFVVKLNEDDILEILLEYFQKGKYATSQACGKILGQPGDDLRFVAVINRGEPRIYDLDEIDKTTSFNGDHSDMHKYPQFDLSKKEDI